MKRQRALELLASSKPELQARFGVTRLALFGSTARDTAASGSDVDILVAFDGPATSKRYFGVQFYLEDLLGCPVDLVTEKALRPELRPYIEQERVPSHRGKDRGAGKTPHPRHAAPSVDGIERAQVSSGPSSCTFHSIRTPHCSHRYFVISFPVTASASKS